MKYGIAFLMLLFLVSCSKEEAKKPLNLLQYGLPVTIQAPDSAKVKTSDMGIFKDISVTSGDNYSVQIFASTAINVDILKIKTDQLNTVQNTPYFSKLVREEDQGFIFENKIDSTSNYSFRYIQVMGDQEIIYQTGMSGIFSLEDVEEMYESVKQ